jgi:hypothetical protein
MIDEGDFDSYDDAIRGHVDETGVYVYGIDYARLGELLPRIAETMIVSIDLDVFVGLPGKELRRVGRVADWPRDPAPSLLGAGSRAFCVQSLWQIPLASDLRSGSVAALNRADYRQGHRSHAGQVLRDRCSSPASGAARRAKGRTALSHHPGPSGSCSPPAHDGRTCRRNSAAPAGWRTASGALAATLLHASAPDLNEPRQPLRAAPLLLMSRGGQDRGFRPLAQRANHRIRYPPKSVATEPAARLKNREPGSVGHESVFWEKWD